MFSSEKLLLTFIDELPGYKKNPNVWAQMISIMMAL
jgi:hypothetical protein